MFAGADDLEGVGRPGLLVTQWGEACIWGSRKASWVCSKDTSVVGMAP